MMRPEDIFARLELTVLAPLATRAEIRQLCDDAIRLHTASVCVPPCYVEDVKRYIGRRLPVGTVVGYPNGFETSSAKAFMAADAAGKGADEVEMAVNAGWIRDGKYADVEAEIAMVKAACRGSTLKVIIPADILSEEEMIRMCRIVSEAKADYVTVSESRGGKCVPADTIRLLREYTAPEAKILVRGEMGSGSYETYIQSGAERFGTRKI